MHKATIFYNFQFSRQMTRLGAMTFFKNWNYTKDKIWSALRFILPPVRFKNLAYRSVTKDDGIEMPYKYDSQSLCNEITYS